MPTDSAAPSRFRKLCGLLLLQLLLVVLVPTAVFQFQKKQATADHLHQLSSMAHQKAAQTDTWLAERVGDALVLQKNPLFIQAAIELNRNPDYTAEEIGETFSQLQRQFGYESLTFFDKNNIRRATWGNVPEWRLNSSSFKTSTRNITTDWFKDNERQLHMGVRIPLRDPNSYFTIGSLLLTQAVKNSLLPRIEIWPANQTGITYLLQSYDKRILSIRIPANNSLKSQIDEQPYSANSPRLLLKALATEGGTFDGKDEQQRDVFASYEPVGYSGWHIIMQQEQHDVLAPLYRQAIWVATLVLTVGLIVILFIYMQWRRQEYQYELELHRQTAEKDRLLRHFFELPLFGMAITHSRSGNWIRFNDQLCQLLGFSREEMSGVTLASLFTSTDPQLNLMENGSLNGYQQERELQHKDGHLIYAKVDTRCVREENGRISFIITVIEDISQRKASENDLKKQTNLYNMLSRTNQAIVHSQTRQELFDRICQTAIEDGGFSVAMIGQCTPAKDDLNIMHTAGDTTGFCEWITQNKGKNPDLIPRTGAMQAVYQQRNLVINDYLNITLTTPFHDIAEKADIRSAGYYPIIDDDKIFGVLSLYASEKDFFTEKVQATLEEVAGDIGFALENMKRDQQLIASERLFHNLATFVRVGIFRLDLHGKLLYINEFGTSLLRMDDYIPCDNWLENLDPDYYQLLNEKWLPELLQYNESEMECRLHDHADHEVWLIIHARAETDTQGKVIGYIGTLTDIRKIKETEKQLTHQAHYDSLTELPNRTMLRLNLQQAIEHSQHNNKRIALLLIDLDHFKDVNDSFGHPMGDVLLKDVAKRLQQHLPDPDQISRIGGDEFTILLTQNPSTEYINAISYDIIQLLKQPFHLPNSRDVILGASIGISICPEHSSQPTELVQKADTAMYHAKASGRNCYKYFSNELSSIAEKRLDIEIRLKRAIERNELRAFYQPQVDIRSGKIIGAEALIRWQDPQRGLLSPAYFVPIAEESGLIKPIGEWILKETCRQGKEWLDKGLPQLTLAVNLSPIQFRYNDLLNVVRLTLDETQYPAGNLELELTESALMAREKEAIEIMTQLRQAGIRLAIDDFGTGYSSLSYLKRFPLDVLKIDKSFVDDLPHEKDDMEIAITIIAMARILRLKVLAEGVENMEQLNFLKEQECDIYQGYLMSKPLPADEFEVLLRKNYNIIE